MNRRTIQWIRAATKRYSAPKWTPDVVRGLARRTSKRLYRRYHERTMKLALAGRIANLDDAAMFLREGAIRLKLPLVIISQVQRSGGTLLSQLLDGHPALCAYPQELKFDFPEADSWPELDPARSADWNFSRLFDRNFPQQVRRGFTKGDRNVTRHPFMLMSHVQYDLFQHLFGTQRASTARDIFDHFFTAFFNAWLNYQGSLEKKSWITAFAPRLAHHETHVSHFFSDYSDGRLIQVLRDPRTWYPSAKNHAKSAMSSKGIEYIIERWQTSAESMLRNRSRYGDKVIIVRFEDLVGRTEDTMRALSHKFDIAWDAILAEPTFNGKPIRANSSFAVETGGIIQAPLRREALLSAEDRELIDRYCLDLYDKVAAEALSFSKEAPIRASAAREAGFASMVTK